LRSEVNALATFTILQLESKWKHAADFGITTPKRNPTTPALYQAAIESHLADVATIQNGSYLYVPGSKVFYNPITNLIVIQDGDDAFVSGWRLTLGSPQWNELIIDGVLR
jgi:filamentous hemagglutinin